MVGSAFRFVEMLDLCWVVCDDEAGCIVFTDLG